MPDNFFAPVQELPVAQGFRCGHKDCESVHFRCCECGHEGSVETEKVTPIFSATCHFHQGHIFLVDFRHLLNFTGKAN